MKIYTTAEAAKELGDISIRRVQAMISKGSLKATRFGRVWQIKETDLDKVRNRKTGRPSRGKNEDDQKKV